MCIDANEREKILSTTAPNILVDASAGTGKTTIMVEKALLFINRSEFRHYQRVAMITFTRFATQQIRDKITEADPIGNRKQKLEVSTNNGFVLAEIIRPFLRESYGKEYPRSEVFKQDFSKEYKFQCWESGMRQLQEKKVLGSYKDPKTDFTFQLALNILKRSKNARNYIVAKYTAIFLDEYQDSGREMHDFFIYLKNDLNISLFIVGDIKQAIYGFRGADSNLFTSLYDSDFNCYRLSHNFRSDMSIINYSRYFLGESITQDNISGGVNLGVHTDWKQYICGKTQVMEEGETAVYLVNSLGYYKGLIKYLEDYCGFVQMEDPPLGTEYPNFDVLSPLLYYYHDENYNEFDLINDLGLQILKKIQVSIGEIRILLKNMQVEKALDLFSNVTERQLGEEEEMKFTECLEQKWSEQFCIIKPRKQIMTIHKSKGLDFNHVFIDASSFYHRGEFQEKNHYVAITRAKKMLFINLNTQYQKCISGIRV
ncbi:UvrD-helicase domain-containing protein [Sporosarcina sp. E16_8]|uniref:UvrD-helicase domain-containing protein n=1 Tax=Sporosarcina sp. E16_8 TaxID=2789295 RepID=UPI00210247BA|nr:UvrD-helicase domain-containing protein [Sporosarcina sp. E16_8]